MALRTIELFEEISWKAANCYHEIGTALTNSNQLAFNLNFPEKIDCKTIFAEPLPIVIQALQTYNKWDELLKNLPDLERIF